MCTALDVGLSQSKYTALKAFSDNFAQFISELPTDQEKEQILPVNGEPGYWWRPEVVSVVKEEMIASLTRAAKAMVHFKMNVSVQEAEVITSQVTCNFLQGSALELMIACRIQ